MKRFLAVLLCLVMLFSLAPYSAFAEGEEQDASVTEQVNEKTEEETKREEPAETSAEETKQEESAEPSAESEQPAESETPVNEESAVAEPAAEESAKVEEVVAEEENSELYLSLDTSNIKTFEELKAAIASSGTIQLGADIEFEECLTIKKDTEVILDFNGYNLSIPEKCTNRAFEVKGTLTLKNSSSDESTFTDKSTASAGLYGSLIRANGGTVNIESGTFTRASGGTNYSLIQAYSNSNSTVNIYGGTFNGYNKSFVGSKNSVGIFSKSTDSTIVIKGGTFNCEPTATYIGENCEVTGTPESEPTLWTVSRLPVASVTIGESTTNYTEFDKAIDAAISGSTAEDTIVPVTITLLKDFTTEKRYNLRDSSGIDDEHAYIFTFDIGKFNYSYSGTNSGAFLLAKNATLTIKGSGTFDTGSKQFLYIASSGNSVYIDGVELKTECSSLFYTGSKSGTAAPVIGISSGKINAVNYSSFGTNSVTPNVSITGGTFNFNPEAYATDFTVTGIPQDEPTSWTVSGTAVASVTTGGNVLYYTDLKNAIEKALTATEVTITLLENVPVSEQIGFTNSGTDTTSRNITFDLNDKNLTTSSTNGVFGLGSGISLTLNNSGTIYYDDSVTDTTNRYIANLETGSSLIITNGDYSAAKAIGAGDGCIVDNVHITGGVFGFNPSNYADDIYQFTDYGYGTVWSLDTASTATPTATVTAAGYTYQCKNVITAFSKALILTSSSATVKLLSAQNIITSEPITICNQKCITFDLNGCKYTDNDTNQKSFVVKDGSTLIVEDLTGNNSGEFNPTSTTDNFYAEDTSRIEITGGTIKGKIGKDTDATVVITGGIFNNDPSSYVNTEEYSVAEENSIWTVSRIIRVNLTVGETIAQFAKIEEAYEELEKLESSQSATITLLQDVTVDSQLVNKISLTINLNGHKITGTDELSKADYKRIFKVSANLTITGNGLIDASKEDCYIAAVDTGKTLTVSGGNFKTGKNKTSGYNYFFTNTGKGIINFSGESGSSWFNNKLLSNDKPDNDGVGVIEVKGSEDTTKYPYDSSMPYTYTTSVYTITYSADDAVQDSVPESQTTSYLEGYTIEQTPVKTRVNPPYRAESDGKYWIFSKWIGSDENEYASGVTIENLTGDLTLTAVWAENTTPYASLINGESATTYSTISEAVANAVPGDTVKIINDASENVIIPEGTSVTIDLNGKNITGASTGSAITNEGTLILQGTGKIYGEAQTSGGAIDNRDSGTLTINGVTIDGTAKQSGGGICSKGTVIMNSGSIDGTVGRSDSTTIYGGGGVYINGGTFTMNGGTIKGTALPNPEDSTFVPNGGGAVYVSGGTFNMNAGTVEGSITGATQENSASFYVSSNSNSILTINGKEAYVKGGIYKGGKGTVEISQGLFIVEPDDNYISASSKCVTISGDYQYKVAEAFVITVSSKISGTDDTIAKMTGGGPYTNDEKVSITAPVVKGFTFIGWYKDYGTDTEGKITEDNPYVFNPTEDLNLCAVYDSYASQKFTLSITGKNNAKFTVTINGVTEEDDKNVHIYSNTEMNAADKVTVEFTDTSRNFQYWANESNKVVDKTGVYEFTMGSDVTLNAVSSEKSGEGTEVNSALVVFKSAYDQIISVETYTTDTKEEEITIPVGPSKSGYTFVKWKFDGDDTTEVNEKNIKDKISESTGIINIVPVYKETEDTYNVTVKYSVPGIEKEDQTYENNYVRNSCKVTADKTITIGEGESATTYNFLYWSDKAENGGVLSYETEYYVRALEDVTIYAIYSSDKEVTEDVCINITSRTDDTEVGETKDRYTYIEQYSLPSDDYKVVKVGYVYTTDDTTGTPEQLILGNENVNNAESTLSQREGIYILNLNISKEKEANLYVRGYIQYTKPGDTKVYIMYTDINTVARKSA